MMASRGSAVRFGVLGTLEVWDGEDKLRLGGQRSHGVLAALLLDANRIVPMSRLVDAVWEWAPPATAEHQIRKVVADLRARIPGGQHHLVTDGPGYRIVVEDDQLDLTRLDKYLALARRCHAVDDIDGEAAVLEAALSLHRGRVLPDCRTSLLEAAAAAVEERLLGARERLLELRLEQGRAHDAVGELRNLVAEHPLRESLSALLMVALYRVGRQADALRVYRDLRTLLAEQLGIEPGPEADLRHQQILRNEPDLYDPAPQTQTPRRSVSEAPPKEQPRSLPHDLSDFTGRQAEMRWLLSNVPDGVDEPTKVITIDGMGGSGKSTLAVHAGHRLAGRFPDGQLFLDLHGFTPGFEPVGPRTALATLLRAIGVPGERIPDDLADREGLWRGMTAGRRLLLLFDNAATSQQVRPLMPGGPGCLVLVTSRARLAGLDGAVPLPLPLPTPADGLALLRGVLGRERVLAEPEPAAELVALCGQLPLALRIAASRLRNRPQWTIASMVGRLQGEVPRLGELVAEQRSVRVVLELSRASMPARHQQLFGLLGVHPGTDFDGHTVAALARLPLESAELLLEDLLDARLLIQRTPGRYVFHDLVRSLARDAAEADSATARRARHRLLDYYLCAADEAASVIQPDRERLAVPLAHRPDVLPPLPDREAALAWFQTERANLLAALVHAEEAGFDQHVARLPQALTPYLRVRGHTEDELGVLHKAVAAARRMGDAELEGQALTNLATPYWYLGRVKEGLACAQEALAIAERLGDSLGIAFCLSRISMFYNTMGQYENAILFLHRSLVIFSRAGARREEGAALASLGEAQFALGRHAEALQTNRMMILNSRRIGDPYGEIVGLAGEAASHAEGGGYEIALDRLAEASVLARRHATPYGQASVLARYADVYRRQRRHAEALMAGHAALELLRSLSRPAVTAFVHNVIGAVHRDRGEYTLGQVHHQQARQIAQRIGMRRELLIALEGAADAREASGGPDPEADGADGGPGGVPGADNCSSRAS
ncbi:BTAD domain-containing putative transcriptional regulator [Streptomyces sp. NPDC057302]|uniref:AfsR/SARP family transcriptional regulator n=1 Tax=Streptomyces sp. NPDC057302 TaxID=3346094 RepID=UPI00363203B1